MGETTGAGIINRMWFTFSGYLFEYWDPAKEPDPSILKKLILRIYWDGNEFPSVEVPMIDFFGLGFPEYRHFVSKYIALSSGGYTSYFQMPFEKGVKIEIENRHDTMPVEVFMNVNYTALESLPENSGRFHAQYIQCDTDRTEKTLILKTNGKGKFVGCTLSMQARDRNFISFLEAPEYVFIDQDEEDTSDLTKAAIVGTGLEDYFNGAWYFREGTFASPLYGVPIKDNFNSMVTMYRFHEEDAISFNKSIEFSFIWPLFNDAFKNVKYTSVAYYYLDQAQQPAIPLPEKDAMITWYRTREFDHLAFP